MRPLMFRTFVALAYLCALLLHGRWDGRSALLALAVLGVWATPALRDAHRARGVAGPISVR